MSVSWRPFDLLATELLELVFSNLDARNIVCATSICRRFARTIRSSSRLQYQIELELEGLAEDPLYPAIALPDRIQHLARYKRCWNELQFPTDNRTFHGTAERDCFPAGRWFVDRDVEESAVRIVDMSTACGDVHELEWREMKLDGAFKHYSTIALHGLDMLIVMGVARRIDADHLVPKVSLLHAATFGPHPLVEKHELEWPEAAGTTGSVNWGSMGLCGRSLAVTLRDRRTCVVWDWLLGKQLLAYELKPPRDRVAVGNWLLLAERTFCWTEHEHGGLVVLVVRGFDENGNVSNIGRWSFPPLAAKAFVGEVHLTTDDADEIEACHRLSSRYPFATDGADSVVALTISSFIPQGSGTPRETAWTFYALRSTFLAVQPNDDIVPWSQWGRENTRCIPGDAHCIRGCRAVHGLYINERRSKTSVLSFLPLASRRAAHPPSATSVLYPDHRMQERPRTLAPTVIEQPRMFKDPVETALPYLDAKPEGMPPYTAATSWEDGRVVWSSILDPQTTYVATL
ncbi:hypothetical protein EXIGLDRAFT_842147 [Exidia glandulosa HHB12029]|uniref:F-box domain-containing protein n=1 Tax=Exidia glandulosa HHB12029 TaxID=1314781 RepID=A0A165ZNV6_EXIGL|nr:hypothetical protein EXIGLDRAFT_842147 [Exidia glandulosa HHB12029]